MRKNVRHDLHDREHPVQRDDGPLPGHSLHLVARRRHDAYITGRFGVGNNSPETLKIMPRGVMYEIQKMYYDTAQAYSEYTLPTFTKVIPNSHILFGTDYPLAAGPLAVAKGLSDYGLSAANLRAIERDNALELIPRLKKV